MAETDVSLIETAAKSSIKSLSLSYKGVSQLETIYNLENFINQNLKYEYFQYQRPINHVLKDWRGDCTDAHNLLRHLLKYHGIVAYPVHGYANEIKHDWLRITIDYDIMGFNSTELEFKGYGFW